MFLPGATEGHAMKYGGAFRLRESRSLLLPRSPLAINLGLPGTAAVITIVPCTFPPIGASPLFAICPPLLDPIVDVDATLSQLGFDPISVCEVTGEFAFHPFTY